MPDTVFCNTELFRACQYLLMLLVAVIITEFGSDCDLYNGLSSAKCQAGDTRYLQDLAAYFLNTAGVVPLQYMAFHSWPLLYSCDG